MAICFCVLVELCPKVCTCTQQFGLNGCLFHIQKVLSMLEEAVIFGHEGCDCKGPPLDIDGVLQYGIVMALYEQDGKTVHLYYWRDALEEEKAVGLLI